MIATPPTPSSSEAANGDELDGAAGPPDATGSLAAAVYAHLKAIAQLQMNGERPGHTLSATALVHEAFARLGTHPALGGAGANPGSPQYGTFMRVAAEAMRRVLIEHGRARGRLKRGGKAASRIPLGTIRDVAQLADDDLAEQIVALDDAFRRLEAHDARFADVIRLRFYAGLSIAETALVLGVSERTVNVDWTYARAWLARDLKQMDAQ